VDILAAHRMLLDFAGRNDDSHKDNQRDGDAMKIRLALLLALLIPIGAQAEDDEPSQALQVQEIRCTGNSHVSCDFIRGHLYLNAGATLDEEEIRNAELRLSSLRYFNSATIHLEKGAVRGAVVVVIDVTENNPVRVESVVGAAHRLDVGRVTVGSRIAHQNLFGEGKFADVTAVATVPVSGPGRNESYLVLTRYVDPMLFDSRRWFGFVAASLSKGDFEDQYGNFAHTEVLDLIRSRRRTQPGLLVRHLVRLELGRRPAVSNSRVHVQRQCRPDPRRWHGLRGRSAIPQDLGLAGFLLDAESWRRSDD
jgi:hypothetical protein